MKYETFMAYLHLIHHNVFKLIISYRFWTAYLIKPSQPNKTLENGCGDRMHVKVVSGSQVNQPLQD